MVDNPLRFGYAKSYQPLLKLKLREIDMETLLKNMNLVLSLDGTLLSFDETVALVNRVAWRGEEGDVRVRLTIAPYCGEFSYGLLNGGILRGQEEESHDRNEPAVLWVTTDPEQESTGINVDIIEHVEIYVSKRL